MKLEFENGKYTVVETGDGYLEALRYGEPWRTLTGDNLFYAMAHEIHDFREACGGLEGLTPGILKDLLEVAKAALPLIEDRMEDAESRATQAKDFEGTIEAEGHARVAGSLRLQAEFARDTLAKLGVVPARETANPEPVSPQP